MSSFDTTKYNTFDSFLTDLKSSAPTPGGGAVAALAGALAAALTEMVVNLTIGKKAYVAVDEKFRSMVEPLDQIIQQFKELAIADETAFNLVMDAWKLKKTSPEDKVVRSEAIAQAARSASIVPQQTVKCCELTLSLAKTVSEFGNSQVISDAGVAALLLYAAVRAAAMNIRVNLPLLNELDRREMTLFLETAVPPLLQEALDISTDVERRLGKPAS